MSYLSRFNPDGWGVAWFNGREWRLFKEPLALHESRRARSIARSVRGLIIISHVRFATHGGRSVVNTHPWLYRSFVFAHNGYLDRERLLRLVKQEYRDFKGETDSEVLFHFLVQEALGSRDFVEGVKRTVGRIIEEGVDYNSLNFIASDGVKLYALRYARRSLDYYTLYYLERSREALHLDKLSSKTAQLIRMKLARGERAVLVASEPLTEEGWREIPNKHLLIVNEDLSVELLKID
jgi:glutamine amidotransferase